ncbi:MAG: SDR family oxidoreductase [Brevundimonas mediterranea]|jgi:short-subunit dehydrogenase|uniref:SDR family NAD(P)-dependent oxidoreductase n=1 Tax=Brevundimonas mediterranea TaxID=74329 RepID=A0AB37E3M0_9CAUL|nr:MULTISPECIES: SDR family oxidoreductase [Brevundimonas]EDX80601.1 oxidoreductase, short chain dehydrogenase/reductase family [Brevundimonas sp. BAL3]MBA4331263.1 KR domain-containing protein [Brevundimonas sp.]QIH71786.1 SDR family NAD(P)-dependent oxidoreductase [Brevundimonas mediterranea]
MSAKPVLKPLGEQSIVVTGATSGVGLATVRRAARAGARVFLIARGERDLRALCEELQAQGARVAWAVADAADPEALKAAVEKCVRLFGGFDTWVNNAGVGMFGSIRETRLEDQRRLFETNYWGVVNGSLAAAEHLRTRPGGGAIINVGSILSDLPLPVQGVYAASKHAVKGFTNALRIELLREQAPVTVSLVKPGAIDTPYSRHARNLTGQAVHNPQPVYATHVVADTILYCAAHPIREITVGGGGRVIASFYSALPGIAEPLLARFAPSLMRDRRSAYRPYDDGLYDPTEDGLDEEVHYPMVRNFSALAEVRKHPGVTASSLVALAAGAAVVLYLTQRSGPTRYQRIKTRIDPRGWVDTEDLRDRFHDAVDAFRHRAEDAGERAGDFSREARHRAADAAHDARDRADEWFRSTRKGSRKALKKHGKAARRYADDAGAYARDHAREGGALLAVATIAAAVGAAVLESRRPDSHVRRIARF